MFCLMSSQKYLPCCIKSCRGQLVRQEFIQYIQQVLLKLIPLATALTVIITNQYTVFRGKGSRVSGVKRLLCMDFEVATSRCATGCLDCCGRENPQRMKAA